MNPLHWIDNNHDKATPYLIAGIVICLGLAVVMLVRIHN